MIFFVLLYMTAKHYIKVVRMQQDWVSYFCNICIQGAGHCAIIPSTNYLLARTMTFRGSTSSNYDLQSARFIVILVSFVREERVTHVLNFEGGGGININIKGNHELFNCL